MTAGLLVVGGGIAGCEAAFAAARAGTDTVLVTTSLDTLYVMAHGARELRPPPSSLMAACLGGAERAAANGARLRREAKRLLEREPRLHLLQSTVSELLVEEGVVVGAGTWEGPVIRASSVALCVGSFLGARLRVGASVEHAGRLSEMAYDDLRDDLVRRGFALRPERLALDGAGGALPYTVHFDVLTAAEVGEGRHAAPRLAGLYAAGACLGRFGYEACASDGMALAAAVLGAGDGAQSGRAAPGALLL